MTTATRSTRVPPEMAARVMAPKPAWRIVADFPNGASFRGHLCAGLYATADEAIAAFRRYGGFPVKGGTLRAEAVVK